MSTNLELALWRLWRELNSVGAKRSEWAIFGSTTLSLRGTIDREVGDIDVFVSRRVWGALLAQPGWEVETPNAGDPPILTYLAYDIPFHLFYDWRDDNVEIDAGYLIDTADTVNLPGVGPYNVASLEEVLRHKRAALAYGTLQVQKHRPDIEAIEAFMLAQKLRGEHGSLQEHD